ncbi:dihydropteroate synthase [Chloroflexota bacterium]
MLIIGETLNASIKTVADAIIARDDNFVARLAKEQVKAGANMLDVNAGIGTRDEYADLPWLVHTTQNAVDVPLVLDSSNPEVLVATFAECRQRPMLSSINGEPHNMEVLLPFIAEHDCSVLGMCVGGKGIPTTAGEIFEVAKLLIDKTAQAGLKPQDLYLDPAVMAVAADATSVQKMVAAMRLIKEYQPKVNTVCAVSNVSFGLPRRKLLNHTFIPILMSAGVDALITDVRDKDAMACILTAEALLGKDENCINYIRAYRGGKL